MKRWWTITYISIPFPESVFVTVRARRLAPLRQDQPFCDPGVVSLDHVHHVVLVRIGARSGARWRADLGENVVDVPGDRVLADDQGRRDFAIGLADRDESQHLHLTSGQPVARLASPHGVHAGDVGRRAEFGEG
jgi:hypothetical protein